MGVLKLKSGPSLKLKSGPSFFTVFPIFIVFLGIFRNTNSATVCQNSVFLQNFGDVKNEVFEKKIAFFVFPFLCWKNRNRKKKKNENGKGQKTL